MAWMHYSSCSPTSGWIVAFLFCAYTFWISGVNTQTERGRRIKTPQVMNSSEHVASSAFPAAKHLKGGRYPVNCSVHRCEPAHLWSHKSRRQTLGRSPSPILGDASGTSHICIYRKSHTWFSTPMRLCPNDSHGSIWVCTLVGW